MNDYIPTVTVEHWGYMNGDFVKNRITFVCDIVGVDQYIYAKVEAPFSDKFTLFQYPIFLN